MQEIRWYGRGGQGAFTAARLLGLTASVYGKGYALAFPSFGPERRGAPVWSFTRIDTEKIIDRSQPTECNYLIVLDETLLKKETCDVLRQDGIVILNTAKPEKYQFINQKIVALDATKLAMDVLGKPIANVAMFGAFIGASGIVTLDDAEKALEQMFSPAFFEKNKQLMLKAHAIVKGDDKVD